MIGYILYKIINAINKPNKHAPCKTNKSSLPSGAYLSIFQPLRGMFSPSLASHPHQLWPSIFLIPSYPIQWSNKFTIIKKKTFQFFSVDFLVGIIQVLPFYRTQTHHIKIVSSPHDPAITFTPHNKDSRMQHMTQHSSRRSKIRGLDVACSNCQLPIAWDLNLHCYNVVRFVAPVPRETKSQNDVGSST